MTQDSDSSRLPLSDFLRNERDAILDDWERLNREHLHASDDLSSKRLRNRLPDMLEVFAQQDGSNKRAFEKFDRLESCPKRHAEQRWRLGFTLSELTREYGLLRSVILQRLGRHLDALPSGALVFLNEALDEAIMEGVDTYVTQSNQKLQDEQERLQVTLQCIADGVIRTDPDGNVAYMNPTAETMTGWPLDDALGKPVSEVLIAVDESTRDPIKSLVHIAAESDEPSRHSGEILLRQRSGELLPAEEVAVPLKDSKGNFLGVVATFHDVSNVRALTSQLGYLATHDPLTDLPNRILLSDRLELEVGHAERDHGQLALLYLDLDLFKEVNDTFGHSTGDELLKQVARRLQKCVRRTDTVCRVGGDEFVILLTGFEQTAYLSELSGCIVERISAPYIIGDEALEMSTSIGISVFPKDGRDPEALIRHADVAMFQAKAQGRNNVQFFAKEMNKQAKERRELQSELRKAVSGNQLSLHFQPQFELNGRQLIGAEVLLRWHHPVLGEVSPGRFIPVAEETRDVMVAIGDWVMEQACRQVRYWLDAGYPPLRVSVNVSIVQLRDERLLDHVAELLTRFRLPPDLLQLELTESTLMSEIKGANGRIAALEALGVRIAVDDFGTGYSSLSYLKDLPADELKIDQSFVSNVSSDESKASIVQAIIRMGRSLKLRVIAEGVENQETVAFLSANDCEAAQGFFYSKAVVPGDFERQFLRPH